MEKEKLEELLEKKGEGQEAEKDESSKEKDAEVGGNEPKEDEEEEAKKLDLTQDELDEIIRKRLERDRKKAEEDKQKAIAEKLAEEGKYKELAEALQAKLDEAEKEVVTTLRKTALTTAGYKDEQAEFILGTLKGATEDEIKEEVAKLKELFPVQPEKTYADPSLGNGSGTGGKGKPKGEDLGRSLYDRVRGKK